MDREVTTVPSGFNRRESDASEERNCKGTISMWQMRSKVNETNKRQGRRNESEACHGSEYCGASQEFDDNWLGWCRGMAKIGISSQAADMVIGSIIGINAVIIGGEQVMSESSDFEEELNLLSKVEFFFIGIYTIELAIRLFGLGLVCLRETWVQLDATLVVIGVSSVIFQWFSRELITFRTVRLLRLARTVRLLKKFKSLWLLVHGLLNSTSTMISTFVLIFIIIFVFGCVGTELVKNAPDQDLEFQAAALEYFDTLPLTMLTLVQFVCLDSISAVYRPLVRRHSYLMFYFGGVILIVSVLLMNLVTAVIVNAALEQAHQDSEANAIHEAQRKTQLISELRDMFLRLDIDKSGMISPDELLTLDESDLAVLQELMMACDPCEIFTELDVNKSGSLDINEFCDGVLRVVVSKVPVEIRRIDQRTNMLLNHFQEAIPQIRKDNQIHERVLGKVADMSQSLRLLMLPEKGSRLSSGVDSLHQDAVETPDWAKFVLDEVGHLRREVQQYLQSSLLTDLRDDGRPQSSLSQKQATPPILAGHAVAIKTSEHHEVGDSEQSQRLRSLFRDKDLILEQLNIASSKLDLAMNRLDTWSLWEKDFLDSGADTSWTLRASGSAAKPSHNAVPGEGSLRDPNELLLASNASNARSGRGRRRSRRCPDGDGHRVGSLTTSHEHGS